MLLPRMPTARRRTSTSARCNRRTAAPVSRFAGVDVPHARDAPLIKEKNLDRRRPPRKHTDKGLRSKAFRKGLDAQCGIPGLARLDQPDAAELPHVRKREPLSVRKKDLDVRVGRLLLAAA